MKSLLGQGLIGVTNVEFWSVTFHSADPQHVQMNIWNWNNPKLRIIHFGLLQGTGES